MSTAKKSTKRKRTVTQTPEQTEDAAANAQTERSLYVDFVVWTDKTKPKWHPVKKMRYVFFRMIDGCTIQDAIKEIRWSASEFWHLVDLKRNAPFRDEYKRAKQLQGRALGDYVMEIAEGRDKVTKKAMRRIQKLADKTLKKIGKQKNPTMAKMMIESLLAKLEENDRGIIARNKLQIDGVKWLAGAVNPNEFSQKSSVALTGGDGEGGGSPAPILIQFIAADGTPVDP